MDIDWTQPYVLIFEWGLFILGWLLLFVLSALVFMVVYAFARALVLTILGKRPGPKRKGAEVASDVKRDIYGRFTL